MKKIMLLIICLIICLISFSEWAYAEDVNIFQECSDVLKPNVLVLFDTSVSMREVDVLDSGIPAYDPKTTYPGRFGKDQVCKFQAGIWQSFGISVEVENLTRCVSGNGCTAYTDLKSQAYSLDQKVEWAWTGNEFRCGGLIKYQLALGNYVNYLKIVKEQQEKYQYEENDYDYTIDYGSDMADGKDRNQLFYFDGTKTRPLCLPAKYVKDITYWTDITKDYMEENRQALLEKGWNRMQISPCTLRWGIFPYFLKTGNFINYLEKKYSRRYVSINAVKNVIEANHSKVRFGIMQFDLDYAWQGLTKNYAIWKSQGGDLAAPCGATKAELLQVLTGKYNVESKKQYLQPLFFGHSYVFSTESIDITKMTPLAESMVEAGLYFAGENSWFNDYAGANPYTSPIQCPNQKNYIVILTDGKPHLDFWGDTSIKTKNFYPSFSGGPIGDQDSDGDGKYDETWVDDVAKYLYVNDISDESGDENIVTYPIALKIDRFTDGYKVDPELMQDTADNGQGAGENQGSYYQVTDQQGIEDAFENILYVVVKNSNFTAAATPTTQDDFVYSGDNTYLSYFRIESGSRGKGNVTKYKFENGKVVDINGTQVGGGLQTFGLWSDGVDGDDREPATPYEGAAYVLKHELDSVTFADGDSPSAKLIKVAAKRKILSSTDSKTDSMIALAVGPDAPLANKLVKYIKPDGTIEYYGSEADEFMDYLRATIYSHGSDWPLGDIVHTNVMVAEYPVKSGSLINNEYDIKSYVLAGANDGMLHCFDTDNGKEEWGFIPPTQLERLYLLNSSKYGHEWFVDGGMTLFYKREPYKDGALDTSGQAEYYVQTPKYLIFGERKGGQSYHIMDISSPSAPKYKKTVANETGIDWGESWGRPDLCKIKVGDAEKMAFLVPGGYDPNQNSTTPGNDTKGRHVALYSLEDDSLGDLTTVIGQCGAGTASCISETIDASIIGARIIDHDHDSQRIFSRIYAADMHGNVYHFSDDLKYEGEDVKGKESSDSFGDWSVRHKLFSAQSFPVTVKEVATGVDGTETMTMVDTTYYQKIFHAPVAGYACDTGMVFFGSGDREHPLFSDSVFFDSIYGVMESWTGDTLTKDNLRQYELNYIGLSANDSTNLNKNQFELYETHPATDPADKKGWFFNFPTLREASGGDFYGEKMISNPIIMDDIMIFGTYTPPQSSASTNPGTGSVNCSAEDCNPGEGRIYIVNTCMEAFNVKSIKLGQRNPMPQPTLVFDQDTGKVLINTGSGEIVDPELPVIVPDYWKHSGSAL